MMLFTNRRTLLVSTSLHDQKLGEQVINHIFSHQVLLACPSSRHRDYTGKGLQEGRLGGSWTNAHFLLA